MDERTCPSCGVEYVNHLGLHGTCKLLQEAQFLINRIYNDGSFFNSAIELDNEDGEEIFKDIGSFLEKTKRMSR
jgi:hypothetical protein